MKKAVVCVSFGTSVPAGRENITAVENVLRQAAQERIFVSAFTSGVIRRILKERGEVVHSVAEALEELWKQGVTEVLVQPTHILCGHEYDKLRREAEPWRDRFEKLRIGRPLLTDTGDLQTLAAELSAAYPAQAGETLVLFGHGTDHTANMVYPALQTVFHLSGRPDVLVGTVEGWPAFEDVLAQLKARDGKQVHLVPLMLVAGDHAMNDMAGEEADSWASRLAAEGYTVRCTVQGLGLLPAVQGMYCAHTAVCGGGTALCRRLMEAATTDACIAELDAAGLREPVMRSLLAAIQSHLEYRAAGAFTIGAIVFSNEYGLLGKTETVEEIMEQWKN